MSNLSLSQNTGIVSQMQQRQLIGNSQHININIQQQNNVETLEHVSPPNNKKRQLHSNLPGVNKSNE